jgi:hypothetical protein
LIPYSWAGLPLRPRGAQPAHVLDQHVPQRRFVRPPGIFRRSLDFVLYLFLFVDMSQFPFKVSAWTPDGNHVEEELGEFANLVVATESWHVFVGCYAKRRMTLRQGPCDP